MSKIEFDTLVAGQVVYWYPRDTRHSEYKGSKWEIMSRTGNIIDCWSINERTSLGKISFHRLDCAELEIV